MAELSEPVAAAPTLTIGSFEALIALAAEKRDITMKMALERDVRLVRCEDGQLEIALEASAPKTLVHDLQRKLTAWTGKRWIVVVSQEQGSADRARAGGSAPGRTRARRAKRSAGAGGAQPLPGRQGGRRDAERAAAEAGDVALDPLPDSEED